MRSHFYLFLTAILLLSSRPALLSQPPTASPNPQTNLSDDQATQLAKLALAGLQREYPNKPAHVMTGPQSLLSPQTLHPAFYGCFDWHSSVHGHWMLIRLLQSNPSHALADQSRRQLDLNLSAKNVLAESVYFDEKENKSFERMYGWAWLLRLAAELHTWNDPQGKTWSKNLQPLEDKIVSLTENYLPRLKHPVRTGVHPDTAFALAQLLDYARIVKNTNLENTIVAHANAYYLSDRNYHGDFEPSGEDFFSPSLNEADLMRRVLPPTEFANWLHQFLPELDAPSNSRLLQPVHVSDVTDGKLVHLAGLDLSRAWCMQGIIAGLPENDARIPQLQNAAQAHIQAGMQYVFSGHYEGEHWLGTFAVFAHRKP